MSEYEILLKAYLNACISHDTTKAHALYEAMRAVRHQAPPTTHESLKLKVGV